MSELKFGLVFDFRNPPEWRRDWKAFYDETLEDIQ